MNYAAKTGIVTTAMLLGLAACQNDKPLGKDFGESVTRNMAVQIIDPAPANAGRQVPEMSGQRAEGAMTRYETGKVTDTRSISTTTSITGKSSGQGQGQK